MGDAAGIGPEIVARFFAARPEARAIVVGDGGAMRRACAAFAPELKVTLLADIAAWQPGRGVQVLSVSDLPENTPPGVVSAACGRAAYDSIIAATDLAIAGRVSGVVTAPIHKEALAAAGIKHPGHTEILGERTGTKRFGMMLANAELRVVLVSIHVSLVEAIRLVTPESVLAAILLAEEGTRAFGIARPRIAVAGLNPHAGEGGMFGHEDATAIAPAIGEARARGLDVSGPHPPDTVFMRARAGAFDVVVAQYHDQGLIPVKYLGLDGGVNITVGLPIVRTSVDHGTAFDIAWQGLADPASLIEAFDIAETLSKARFSK